MSKTGDTKTKILELLKKRKMTLTEISKELDLAPSTINQHIKELLDAKAIRLIPNPFVVKWKYYETTHEFGGRETEKPIRVPSITMQPTWRFVPIIIVIAAIIALILNTGIFSPSVIQAQAQLAPGAVPSGITVFSLSDAPTASSITSVNITVSQLEAHSTTTGKWYVIFNGSKTFDLVKLRNTSQLLSGANLSAGSYDELVLTISNATAAINGNEVAVFVPSGTLKIFGNLNISGSENTLSSAGASANSTGNSWINIDFDLARSIHVTGDGKVILLPVINMNGFEHSMISIESNDIITVDKQGKLDSHILSGMDLNGSMHSGEVPVSEDTALNVTASAGGGFGTGIGREGHLHAMIHEESSNTPFSSIISYNNSLVIVTNESESERESIGNAVSTIINSIITGREGGGAAVSANATEISNAVMNIVAGIVMNATGNSTGHNIEHGVSTTAINATASICEGCGAR
jgi:DNA-binding transcriptional ArsR family regulator